MRNEKYFLLLIAILITQTRPSGFAIPKART